MTDTHRVALEFVAGDDRMVGTYHPPAGDDARRPGVLFTNAGYVPRDGHGGLAARMSDQLAAQGVPCFRFDLPTIGEASGQLPEHTSIFFEQVTSGVFVEPVMRLIDALCDTFDLPSLIVAGLCGAAVTSLFAADRMPERVSGLIMFEPELYVTTPSAEPATDGQPTRRRMRPALRARLFSYWGWLRLLTFENRFGRLVRLPRQRLLNVLLPRDRLPAVTNVPLVEAWVRVTDRRLPVLVVTAAGKLREVFYDRVNDVVLPATKQLSVEHHRLAGTNHTLTTGGAIGTATQIVSRWIAGRSARGTLRAVGDVPD